MRIMKEISFFLLALLSNLFNVFCKEDLHLGTFYGVNVFSKGWSSEGAMPAVRMALDHVNKDPSILPEYTLREHWRDSKVYVIKFWKILPTLTFQSCE